MQIGKQCEITFHNYKEAIGIIFELTWLWFFNSLSVVSIWPKMYVSLYRLVKQLI